MNQGKQQSEFDAEHFGKAINGRIGDFFDGFAVVGFVAGRPNQPMIIVSEMDLKTRLAVNALLLSAVSGQAQQQ